MANPNEESLILEIVRGFFDVPSEGMMKMETSSEACSSIREQPARRLQQPI